MNTNSMLFDRFTVQARAALAVAKREALRPGCYSLETEHLLLGILSIPDGMAVRVLQRLGVEPENLRGAVAAAIQPSNQTSGEIHLSPRAKNVIELAMGEMARLGHEYLDTEHLLLGILCQEERSARGLLHSQRVRLDAARAETERIHSQGATEQLQAMSPGSPLSFPVSQLAERLPDLVLQAPLPGGTVLATGAVSLDSARQQLAVTFARRRQRASYLYLLVIGVITALVTISTLQSSQFSAWLGALVSALANAPVLSWRPIADWSPLLVLVYFVLVSVPLLAISMPFVWYLNFALPRRYGLRKGTTRQWMGVLGKSLSIFCIQIWLLAEIIVLLMAVQPQTWWAWAALIQFLFSLLMAHFGPLWLFPLLNQLEPLPEGELTRRLRVLLGRLHLPACDIFQAKVSHRTGTANAFFIGWGNGRRIILTDTLTQNFTLDEIEVILAHELAHLVHHDIWTRLVMRGLTFLGFFYLTYLSLNTFSSLAVPPFLGLLVLFMLLVGFVNLTTRYRRHQENQADEFALQTTGNVQAFKNAMIRLTDMNLMVATSTRHAQHPANYPTLVKRLEHADEFAARCGIPVEPS